MNLFRALGPMLVLGLFMATRAGICAPAGEETIQIGASTIRIAFAANLPLPQPVMVEWVCRAAVAVSNYFGYYPVKELLLNVERGGRGAVNDGVTYGARRIEVRLGWRAKAADLNQDWILTHEMFHLAFPTLDDRYRWMMEGLSDYLEPIARGRVGQLSPEEVWRGIRGRLAAGPAGGRRSRPGQHVSPANASIGAATSIGCWPTCKSGKNKQPPQRG
jgi:hypothetical protein